ncbi:MAG: hypothetical protein LBB74_08000 [Chitinispirillales bacterium]|jgi:hypothetical protein|nr:hypothetical protein [Chitinispirillales bacterium]
MTKYLKLLLLAALAAAVGLVSYSCIEDESEPEPEPEIVYDADVRYTWESAEEHKIQSIAASYGDVKDWIDNVYHDIDYIEEDASEVPLYNGSSLIPNNIYSSTLHGASATGSPYKGAYLPINKGLYTAVCTGDDELGTFDIVANYNINVVGDLSYFEIAFDVGTFTDPQWGGISETAWYSEVRDNPNTDPRLEKAPANGKTKVRKLTKKLSNGGSVTYYFLRRAQK